LFVPFVEEGMLEDVLTDGIIVAIWKSCGTQT
jgi:hypothetical protein